MRPRMLAALALAVAGLLAFIWFFEKDIPSTDERAELAMKVVRVDREEIDRVRIDTGDQAAVVLTRSNESTDDGSVDAETWSIAEPIDARADTGLVDELLASIDNLDIGRTLDAVDLVEAGLDPPRSRVVVGWEGNATEIEVGSEIPASSSMLVKLVDSGQIVVVDSGIWAHLERDPGDWRARDLVRAKASDIGHVTLSGASGRVVLSRRVGDSFVIEEPFEDLAGKDQVGDLLAAITGLRATSFVDQSELSLSDMGLEPAKEWIEFEAASGGTQRIDLGSESSEAEGTRYAKLADQVFETAADFSPSLERAVVDWRSLDLTTMETYEIDRVEISAPDSGDWTLVRSGADWLRNDEEISFTTVSDLIYAIADSKAIGVELMGSGKPLAEQSLRLRVGLAGESSAESFEVFGDAEDEAFKIVVEGRDVVLLADRETVSDIEEKFAAVLAADSRTEGDLDIEGDPVEPESAEDD